MPGARYGPALGLAAAFAFSASAFAAPQLQSVSATPNPLVLDAAARPEVIITVKVQRRPFDFTCNASIDPGDGRRGPDVTWSFGDSVAKSTRYEYRRPGKYRLRVAGSGSDACRGGAETLVIVR